MSSIIFRISLAAPSRWLSPVLGAAAVVLVLAAPSALQASETHESTGTALDGSPGFDDLTPSVPTVEAVGDIVGCEQGDAASCYAVGNRYHGGDGVSRDSVAAVGFVRHACEGAHAPACYDLGVRYLLGEYLPTRPDEARRWIDHSCDLGYGVACAFGATLHRDGIGGDRDVTAAVAMMERGCTLGYLAACQSGESAARAEAGPLEAALPSGATEDVHHAARQCDRGVQAGCVTLANAYLTGDGVPANADRARGIFDDACNWGLLPACVALGR